MDISWTFSGDGLLAFAGGTLALLGVWWSNRQSIKNLEKQLEAECKARAEETERQKMTLARAILLEIHSFYTTHLREVHGKLEKANLDCGLSPLLNPLAASPFPVYYANAGRLAELKQTLVGPIVEFYALAGSYVAMWREYEACEERKLATNEPRNQMIARNSLRPVRAHLPQLIELATQRCRELSSVAEIDFSSLQIAKDRSSTPTDAKKN